MSSKFDTKWNTRPFTFHGDEEIRADLRRGMSIAMYPGGGHGEMKINSIKTFGGSILGLLLFLGIMTVSGTTAQAQYQDPYWRQREIQRQREILRQREIERQRQAQQQSGYYDQYGNWHPTNNGYYNQGYYNQGRRGRNWDGYGNQGGSYELRQTALNAGYNEGMKDGRDDRRRGRYNPNGHGAFQSASKDYNSRFGDRYTYQQYFRQAYLNGYADGYRY